jgi:hypothetical protein
MRLWLLISIALASPTSADTLVACAPGYPGATREAQPTMDAFARAVAEAAGWDPAALAAVYHEAEGAGLERLSAPDASFALVPFAFYLKHRQALKLGPLCQAVRQGGEASEVWSLVAGTGRVPAPSALDGWELISLAAYAPRFVRGPALTRFGPLPSSVRLQASGSLLSGLRRAAAGEKVALLLDGPQAAGLQSLPFAKDLETLARSAPMPASVVCRVAARATPDRAKALTRALVKLHERPSGTAALLAMQLSRFGALDEAELRRAQQAYDAIPDTP